MKARPLAFGLSMTSLPEWSGAAALPLEYREAGE
jgi:hypothetical protein